MFFALALVLALLLLSASSAAALRVLRTQRDVDEFRWKHQDVPVFALLIDDVNSPDSIERLASEKRAHPTEVLVAINAPTTDEFSAHAVPQIVSLSGHHRRRLAEGPKNTFTLRDPSFNPNSAPNLVLLYYAPTETELAIAKFAALAEEFPHHQHLPIDTRTKHPHERMLVQSGPVDPRRHTLVFKSTTCVRHFWSALDLETKYRECAGV